MGVHDTMPSVLFVCTGNQYRSPIAAAYLRRLLREQGVEDWQVDSAGTWALPQQTLRPETSRIAARLGVEVAGHMTRVVDQAMLNDHDLILVMESGHKEALQVEFPTSRERVFLLSEMLDGVPFDIPDPVLSPGDADVTLRDMCDVIRRGLPRIRELAASRGRSAA